MNTTTLDTTAELVSYDPYDGSELGRLPITPTSEIDGIIANARWAQRAWAERPLAERLELLRSVLPHFREQEQALGELISREQGKPIREAGWEITAILGGLERELGEVAEALAPQVIEDDATRSTIHRDPLGVCAAIAPWNFPVLMPHWLVFPALATGNAVVLKPSELTPLCAQAYADIWQRVLPDGLLQVVHGRDEQGKTLVAGDVDLVGFTGSRDAGRHIMRSAADGLKRLILELGSKDPLVVLRDADVDAAADFAAGNSFRNCGQVCVSTERIYVEQPIADRFMQRLLEKTAAIKPGRGLDEGTELGPMVDAGQRDRVLSQVTDAVADGAEVLTGGEPGEGNFLPPTVLINVTHDMRIQREETFGPVAVVQVVADEHEAVRLANDSDLGLGGVVFGEPEHAERVARKLGVGMVGINKSIGGAAGTPWVGARQSGVGFHSSIEGHRQFCQTRVVSRAK
ncbi:MAG: aldehyde dehydrogenase family protein [Planctomycetota bacterium]